MTLPDQGTVLLYALSTLAQTCAALAAFVGALGLYRLQSVRNRREGLLRAIAAELGHSPMLPADQILKMAGNVGASHVKVPALLEEYGRVPSLLRRSVFWFVVFEGWNLSLIGASIVAFNYVPQLASWVWTARAVWIVALGTVGVTACAVFAWTRDNGMSTKAVSENN